MVNPKEASQNQGQGNTKPTRPANLKFVPGHHQIPNPPPEPKPYPAGKR
jgi:hypothetical protein